MCSCVVVTKKPSALRVKKTASKTSTRCVKRSHMSFIFLSAYQKVTSSTQNGRDVCLREGERGPIEKLSFLRLVKFLQ